MKGLGVLMVLVGAAVLILPLLNVQPALLMQLGDFRSIFAAVLILIGVGIFFFSSYE